MNLISRCLQSAKSDLNFGLNEVYYKVLWQLLQNAEALINLLRKTITTEGKLFCY